MTMADALPADTFEHTHLISRAHPEISTTGASAVLLEAQTAAQTAADSARKASAYAALWLFVSLLAGAFITSLAATFGGRRRDA